MGRKVVELTGQRFGRLTVIRGYVNAIVEKQRSCLALSFEEETPKVVVAYFSNL